MNHLIPIDDSKITSNKAVAFMFVDGNAHQVLISGSNLTQILAAWFEQKGIPVSYDPLDGLTLGEPELI